MCIKLSAEGLYSHGHEDDKEGSGWVSLVVAGRGLVPSGLNQRGKSKTGETE